MAEVVRPAMASSSSSPTRRDAHPRPHPHHIDALKLSPLTQSRETGEAVPELGKKGEENKSWAHFVAGGIGGMTAATLTAPLDVLKTRLQSDFYQQQLRVSRAAAATAGLHPARAAMHHLNETIQILGSVHRIEGWRALFKGLGPNLVGVVPARAINFFAYGNTKRLMREHLNNGKDATWIYLSSGVFAGVMTSTATNPIWLVKTRLQLDKSSVEGEVRQNAGGVRRYRNSVDCIRQVVRDEGFRGLYKGMSASYLGVAESTLQWTLYEEMKKSLARREARIVVSGRDKNMFDYTVDWTGKVAAAGVAKLFAAVLTYPHEVARTRLRQAPLANGIPKYHGLIQCFKMIWKEEGMIGMYGGMTPHLMRTVPSAAIMFGMYEGLLLLFGEKS